MFSPDRPPTDGERLTPDQKLNLAPIPPLDVEDPDVGQQQTHQQYVEGLRNMALRGWTKSGAPLDFANAWHTGFSAVREPSFHALLEPVPSFEAYTKEVWGQDPAVVEYILTKSRKETVTKLDDLAQKYNEALARYRANPEDAASVAEMIQLSQEAIDTIRGKE